MDEEKKYTYHIFIVLIFLAMPVLIFLIFILTIYEILAYFVRQIPKVICFLMKKGISFIIEIVKMEKLRKVFTTIMILLITLAIIGMLYDAFMPSVMKYPHDLVQSFSSDVIENESNVLRRNINNTDGIVNIDTKQKDENVEKKEDYIKKEYFDSATYSYNVINTISGIFTPLFSLLAVIAAYLTLRSQRKQNAIQNFENHLFQMIEQQHKLEEKVVKKYGSFRNLYLDFCVIYVYVRHYALHHFGDVNGDKWKKILLKITYYIFYFGADEDFMCDKTFQILTGKYKLDSEKLKALILNLNGKIIEKKLNEENYDLFHTQKSEELGIYYRNLFNAIRYIDWECPEEDKKEYYAKLVRTNLSDFAQLMLYYNMQGERGSAWLIHKKEGKEEVKNPKGDENGYYYSKIKKDGKIKLVRVKDCLLTRYLPIKNCAISVKQLDDNQIQEKLEINRNESYKINDTDNIPSMTEISRMEKKLDIDPRNDGRKELFSDDVIDYELKIGKQDN